MKRGFSTVACPNATMQELIKWAKDANMQTLEIRLDQDDRICGMSEEMLFPCLAEMKRAGVTISDLGTAITLGPYMPEKVARLKKIVELASFVGAKGVRLFLGRYITRRTEITLEDTPDIIRFLKETVDFARESMWHPELATVYPDIPVLLKAYNQYLDV